MYRILALLFIAVLAELGPSRLVDSTDVPKVYADDQAELFSIADLTRALGLPDHEQNAVASWTGETTDNMTEKLFDQAWMDEMQRAWVEDSARIAREQG